MVRRVTAALSVLALSCLPGSVATPAAQDAPWWKALPRPVYGQLERVRVESPWFEVYRVGPGTTALYEPGHWQEAISYLIEGRDRAVLFDTGLGIGDVKAVVDQLTSLPVLVVNSHEHFDHIGGDRLFADVAVADNPAALARLARGTGSLSGQITPETVWKPLPPGFDPTRYETPPIHPTRRLAVRRANTGRIPRRGSNSGTAVDHRPRLSRLSSAVGRETSSRTRTSSA